MAMALIDDPVKRRKCLKYPTWTCYGTHCPERRRIFLELNVNGNFMMIGAFSRSDRKEEIESQRWRKGLRGHLVKRTCR